MLTDSGIFFRVKTVGLETRPLLRRRLVDHISDYTLTHTSIYTFYYDFNVKNKTKMLSKKIDKKYEDRVICTQDSEIVTENRLARAPKSSGQTGRCRISRSAYSSIKEASYCGGVANSLEELTP